jgi:hypothetical protein
MEDNETKVVKKGRKGKATVSNNKKVKKTSARQTVKNNKKGLVGALIGAAIGVAGTYYYMKKEPKA